MPYDNFKKVIDEIGDCLIFVVLWNYGEPLLNSDLGKMIDYCSGKGIITVLSTNGSLLSKERSLELFNAGLKYLIICVDAVTEDIYQKYRGTVKLSEIKNNITQTCNLKKKNKLRFPIIELQFIVMKENEHQASDFFLMAGSWGVDRASLKKFSALRSSGALDEFMPLNSDYLLGCYKSPGFIQKNFCFVPWQSLVINSDGWALPCCSDYFCTEKMGNIFEEDINQIWNNSRCIQFRRRIKYNINSIDICRDCPHDSGQSGSFISTRQF
jgi:radical SAM protein with 4Fe4S-binding SPASM domain